MDKTFSLEALLSRKRVMPSRMSSPSYCYYLAVILSKNIFREMRLSVSRRIDFKISSSSNYLYRGEGEGVEF